MTGMTDKKNKNIKAMYVAHQAANQTVGNR